MKLKKSPIALAVFSLCASIPLAAQAAPTISFKQPTNGKTVSGTLSGSACEATGSSIYRVRFFVDSTTLNTDYGSPYNCSLDTRKLSNGTHTLKAQAWDSSGTSRTTQISINVQNSTSTTNSAPSVSFTAPSSGATVSGTSVTCGANASDSNGIRDVRFLLDGQEIANDSGSPYTCTFDSTKFSNGSHTLTAIATDTLGASRTITRSFNINNTVSGGGGTTNPVPVVAFTKPANGTTVAPGTFVSCTVNATDSDGIKLLEWYFDGKLVNTEGLAPFDTCKVNTTGMSGPKVIRAVATDSKGAKGEASITINVGTSTPTNTAPAISLTSPAANSTISSTNAGFAATASDADGIAKVEMLIGTKVVASKTTAPYSGTMDLTGIANGTHTLTARATDTKGLSTDVARTITVQNTTSGGGDNTGGGGTDTTGGTGTSLPSTNAKAVATFESLGMYWKPGSNPGSAGCTVRYRKKSESAWKEGLNMWYDSRDAECRGSIVHLQPGTDYVVEMGLPGQSPKAGVNTRTWSENFPIAQTINVGDRSTPLEITQGGTANGYILYTGGTIDVANNHAYNIRIAAPYVIVRGFTLKNARQDGILLVEGAKDVVIENNDISNWGRPHPNGMISSDGWKVGENGDSGIAARCGHGTTPWLERTIIQRNKIHHPRYGSHSWSDGHPYGPNATLFKNCGGNHVFRFNEAYSSWGRYFMDVYGGGTNFSMFGMPTSDSDIYGNILMNAWDDAIEAEGANMNVRIWGNYMDQTATGVATTSTSRGPVYVFRNVQNRSRNKSMATLDGDSRLYMFKSGSVDGYKGGRRYVFHNTSLQAPPPAGSSFPLGSGSGLAGPGNGQNLEDTVSRNNIFHIWKSHWNAIYNASATSNDLDYDMTNGGIQSYSGAEKNRVIGTPIYAAGHGWQSEAGGNYQLAPNSPGFDKGVRIPNFNDGFNGAGPDMGAHEAGKPAMQLGVNGSGFTGGGGTDTTGGGTGSTGGVCSSIVCASQ